MLQLAYPPVVAVYSLLSLIRTPWQQSLLRPIFMLYPIGTQEKAT